MSIVGDDHPKESNEEKVCSQLAAASFISFNMTKTGGVCLCLSTQVNIRINWIILAYTSKLMALACLPGWLRSLIAAS